MCDSMDGPTEISWFDDHYYNAPREIIEFLAGDGLSLKGKTVADIGTGDGIIALGLHNAAEPAELVGYDIQTVDTLQLATLARENGVSNGRSSSLRFEQSTASRIPAPDGVFDFVVSWSAFEHISEPETMSREICRVLAPWGTAMIQLYPFYFSEHGDHGWDRPGFAHLVTGQDAPPDDAYLNKITLDGLHVALAAGNLRVGKVELVHHPFHLPSEPVHHRLTDLAIGGVKLLVGKAT